MITLKNVTKKEGSRFILRSINLRIKKGECAAFVGPNGAGKTTLLKVISTLMKPDSGKVMANNLDCGNKSHQLKIREIIGYLDHESMLYDELSVEENLLFAGEMYFLTEKYTKAKIDYLLENLGMAHRRHDKIKNLSRGMKQKIAIARAIIHAPEILLLDEPLTGLDKHAVKVLKSVLRKEKEKKKTILLATHKPEMLENLPDKIIFMDKGRIIGLKE